MKTTRSSVSLLTIAIALASGTAFAQTTTTPPSTTTTTTTTHSGNRESNAALVTRYTTLAGSATAAQNIITSLRTGSSFTFPSTTTGTTTGGTTTGTGTSGTTTATTTTVKNPAGPMGLGSVNIALSLAQAMVKSGAATNLQTALLGSSATTTTTGGTTTGTSTGTTTTSSTQGILQMRASGMGWGQIARKEGVKLGEVQSDLHHSDTAKQDHKGQDHDKHVARTDRADKVTKAEKPERADKPDRPQKPERPEKPEHHGRG